MEEGISAGFNVIKPPFQNGCLLQGTDLFHLGISYISSHHLAVGNPRAIKPMRLNN